MPNLPTLSNCLYLPTELNILHSRITSHLNPTSLSLLHFRNYFQNFLIQLDTKHFMISFSLTIYYIQTQNGFNPHNIITLRHAVVNPALSRTHTHCTYHPYQHSAFSVELLATAYKYFFTPLENVSKWTMHTLVYIMLSHSYAVHLFVCPGTEHVQYAKTYPHKLVPTLCNCT